MTRPVSAIVAPGVDHAFFGPGHRPQARRALGLPTTGPLLLFVGRIQPLKGADVAVRALAAVKDQPDAQLLIVGGPSGPRGEERARPLRSSSTTGIGRRVRFEAPQPHELLSTYYRAADVCLVPSRSESFGLVALEAAACGTPVWPRPSGASRTLVDHGRTGFLVVDPTPERSPPGFGDPRRPLLAERLATAAVVGPAATPGPGPPPCCVPPTRSSQPSDSSSASLVVSVRAVRLPTAGP